MRKRLSLIAVSLVLFALPLAAQMHRGRPATGGAPAGPGMAGAGVVVAPDGTAVTTRLLPPTSSAPAREEIVAVNASGSIAWTFGTDRPVHLVVVAGNLVLASTGARGQMMNGAAEGELIALSLSQGTLAWRLPLDGFATGVEAAPAGGVYVVVTKPAATTGPGRPGMGPGAGFGSDTMMTGPRTLVSVSASGAVLWSVKLSE